MGLLRSARTKKQRVREQRARCQPHTLCDRLSAPHCVDIRHDAEQEEQGAQEVLSFRDPCHGLYVHGMDAKQEAGHSCGDEDGPVREERGPF